MKSVRWKTVEAVVARQAVETLSRLHSMKHVKGAAGEKGTGFGMLLMRKFVTMFGGTV